MATGAHPRILPGTEGMPGVHVLRTLDDCLAIRADLDAAGPGARVVVIGAGFIGSEVAATCHGLGARVTVVEALPTPLARGCWARRWARPARSSIGIRASSSSPGSVSTGSPRIPTDRRRSWSTWSTGPTSRRTWWWWASAWSPPSSGWPTRA